MWLINQKNIYYLGLMEILLIRPLDKGGMGDLTVKHRFKSIVCAQKSPVPLTLGTALIEV